MNQLQIKYTAIFLLALVMFSAFPIINEPGLDDSIIISDTGLKDLEPEDEEQSDPSEMAGTTRGGREPVKAGGVWIEQFETTDDIESSSNVYFSNSGVSLADDEILLFADNFSKDEFDSSRWDINEGEGTQMTSSGMLIAIKSSSHQTAKAYIETHRSWQVSRRLEFEWNSILEDGLNGYGHEIDVFRGAAGDRIWISVEGDMRVILKSSEGDKVIGPPLSLKENKWYQVSCKLTPNSASLKITDKNDKVLNYQNMSHNFDGAGKVRFGFADISNNRGNFEVRMDNVSLYAGYEQTGDILTKPITIDSGHVWDCLKLGKSDMPPATRIELDIVNGLTNIPIPGYMNITENDLDISGIDPNQVSSLGFHIRFYGDVLRTPSLNFLVLSWQPRFSFVDNFVSDAKIALSSNVGITDLSVSLNPGNDEGYFITKAIEIPSYHYWNMLVLDKLEPAENSYIGFTVIDNLSGKAIENYVNLFESELSLKDLDPKRYSSILIRVDFYGYSSKDPILYSLSLNWSANEAPVIIELQGPSSMYRGKSESFTVFITDADEPVDGLNVSMFYSTGPIFGGTAWKTEYINNIYFRNGLWFVEFSPPSDVEIGSYNFMAIVNDFFEIEDRAEWAGILEVQNRPPDAPDVILSPSKPTTVHDLICFSLAPPGSNEDELSTIYRWYKNGILQPGLTIDKVTSDYTAKYDTWRCEAVLFDGIDESQKGYQEVFIENSAPRAIPGYVTIDITEDGKDETGVHLDNYFIDEDNDKLNFTILPTDHLDILFDKKTRLIYLTPEKNWFGTTIAIIYASDDSSDVSKSFFINVEPLNDPPVISAVGNQIIKHEDKKEIKFNALEGEGLKLRIFARDIDGDELLFTSNRTDGKDNDDLDGFSIDKNTGVIIYKPPSGGISEFSVNISVSDNNGSKVYSEFKISVYEKEESTFQQVLFSTNWMILIIICIIIFSIYYGFMLGRAKLKAYMRKKYREKLTGTGRLYANYPMVVVPTDEMEAGRYPAETGEYAALVDPYRAARYSYKQEKTESKLE